MRERQVSAKSIPDGWTDHSGRRTNIGAYAAEGGHINVGGNAIGEQNNYRSRNMTSRELDDAPYGSADVGILTVLAEELTAVVDVLQGHRGYRTAQLYGGQQAHTAVVGAGGEELTVVAVQTLEQGTRSAVVAYERLRRDFHPPVVLLVGIAGAIDARLRIGDVVISDEVIYYDSRRETNRGPRRRGQSQPTPAPLRHRVNEFFRLHPQPITLFGDHQVHVYRGAIGSGDAVITDAGSEIRDYLRAYNEKTLAVETEAGGVGQAFYEQIDIESALTGWLTIRGISDTADESKGGDHHRLAARRAAQVMDRLLPLLKLTPRRRSGDPAS
jgi:adenosylhomocysteine nucleosidase